MAIEYGRLRSVTARDIIRALGREGFFFRWQEGSHQRYQHPDGRRVTVTFHKSSDTFPPKTPKSMFVQACWAEDDLIRLGLMKK